MRSSLSLSLSFFENWDFFRSLTNSTYLNFDRVARRDPRLSPSLSVVGCNDVSRSYRYVCASAIAILRVIAMIEEHGAHGRLIVMLRTTCTFKRIYNERSLRKGCTIAQAGRSRDPKNHSLHRPVLRLLYRHKVPIVRIDFHYRGKKYRYFDSESRQVISTNITLEISNFYW